MICGHQPVRRRPAMNPGVNAQGSHNPACRRPHPLRTLEKRNVAAQAEQPKRNRIRGQGKSQRHSAPEGTQTHWVSGARNRLRAADESSFRSSSVRKSMVPN